MAVALIAVAGLATVSLPLRAADEKAPASASAAAATWVSEQARVGDFPLVSAETGAARIVVSADDFKVVGIAATDLAADIERVTGVRPRLDTGAVASDKNAGTGAGVNSNANASTGTGAGAGGAVVLIGTLGKSPAIDALVAAGKLDVGEVRGKWETFLIATVADPLPGVKSGLAIVGGDRRGTAFGVYELSQAIGVSPWHWWADVTPAKKSALHVAAGARRLGPPSVKYRGIFINDEDWGLQPWAAKTFEPETGDIGPKTYAKVFELLLRLKANTLWPAMHACTKPFNHYAANAPLADDYGIVMGSSHAEPMLRNNVGEWTDAKDKFNYAANRDGVHAYWEERVARNGRFENVYTLGMRGIHDSGMQGGKTPAEQIALLETIFADQRALLAKHVAPGIERVPQMFCAYKEVLELFRGGLRVPDDVTIVWPDDNFGFIRSFASPAERARKGGFGIYYHISYLGRPLAYLWLNTTPPALIWEEMSKAYDHGADRIWIVNVGDIKPAEIGTEFFLQMAWDIGRWKRENLSGFLVEWAAREFGREQASEIAAIMAEYYRLNYQRKPEHLQAWLPNQPARPSGFTPEEIEARLAAFAAIRAAADRVGTALPAAKQDAFFELVGYPVCGSALANERYFQGERAGLAKAAGDEERARAFAAKAEEAHVRLNEETRFFDERVAEGKWRGFMRLEPADNDWRSMRIAPWKLPEFAASAAVSAAAESAVGKTPAGLVQTSGAAPDDFAGFEERNGVVAIEAEHFAHQRAGKAAAWAAVPGLGRSGDAVGVFPTTMASVATEHVAGEAPRLDYPVRFSSAGQFSVHIHLVPTHPIAPGGKLVFALGLDEQAPQIVEFAVEDGKPSWAQGVLSAVRVAQAKIAVDAPGVKTLRIYAVDPGVLLDKVVIDCGGLKPSYLGPAETRRGATLP